MLADATIQTITCRVARTWGDDAAQFGMMRAWEKGVLELDERDASAYVYFVARNYYRTQWVHDMRVVPMGDAVPTTVDTITPLQLAEARQELERLALYPHADMAIACGMGETYADVAETQNIAEGTVKSRISRLRHGD